MEFASALNPKRKGFGVRVFPTLQSLCESCEEGM